LLVAEVLVPHLLNPVHKIEHCLVLHLYPHLLSEVANTFLITGIQLLQPFHLSPQVPLDLVFGLFWVFVSEVVDHVIQTLGLFLEFGLVVLLVLAAGDQLLLLINHLPHLRSKLLVSSISLVEVGVVDEQVLEEVFVVELFFSRSFPAFTENIADSEERLPVVEEAFRF